MECAYMIHQRFEAAPHRLFQMEHHYLLHAESGVVRLDAQGKSWTLPPARAALIRAGEPIGVSLKHDVVASSALFSPRFAPPPEAALSVFDLSPLLRELLRACCAWDVGHVASWDSEEGALFRAMQVVSWRLSQTPSPVVMPLGESEVVQRALALTEARLSDETLTQEGLARELGVSPRTLARRFSSELGMSWRQAAQRLRLLRAIELLAEPERTITEVALLVGYSSLSSFNETFQQFTGKSPSLYRASFTC